MSHRPMLTLPPFRLVGGSCYRSVTHHHRRSSSRTTVARSCLSISRVAAVHSSCSPQRRLLSTSQHPSISLCLSAITTAMIVSSLPQVDASLRCEGSTRDSSSSSTRPSEDLNITLYQYLICPFCSRVKSYLDYSKIPYSAVEVNPLTKGELQSIDSKLKKVPIAIVDGVVVEDSLAIIRAIGEHDHRSSESFNQLWTSDTDFWSEWSEKKLAVMLYPNITRSFEESWECFAYAADVATWNAFMRAAVRVAGPLFMSLANGKIKKKYGIVNEREELHEVLLVWTSALAGKKFLHGDEVSMPDLMVFGVLRSIRGLRTFDEVMAHNPQLGAWYGAVEALSPSSQIIH